MIKNLDRIYSVWNVNYCKYTFIHNPKTDTLTMFMVKKKAQFALGLRSLFDLLLSVSFKDTEHKEKSVRINLV
jgi:hypothetical protein